jgi:hypothetical protein
MFSTKQLTMPQKKEQYMEQSKEFQTSTVLQRKKTQIHHVLTEETLHDDGT